MRSSALLLSAGEASGDVLSAAVLQGLVLAGHKPAVHGIAGPNLRRVASETGLALTPLGAVEELGGAGLVELIPQLPALRAARRNLTRALEDFPGPALLVDAPDLHLPIASRVRPRGPLGLLVAPQFWAWRPGRARTLARSVDFVLCLFRFEVDVLRRAGVAAQWVGHPAVDRAVESGPSPPRRSGPLRVAVLPGSRRSEVSRLLRPMLAAARDLGEAVTIEVAWRTGARPPDEPGLAYSGDCGWTVLERADLALVAAGTATLEAALLGVPTVCVAATHPLTAAVARRLVQVERFALPNLLLGRTLLPEVVQDLNPARIAAALRPLARDADMARATAREGRAELLGRLGPPGFGTRAAAALSPFLEGAAA